MTSNVTLKTLYVPLFLAASLNIGCELGEVENELTEDDSVSMDDETFDRMFPQCAGDIEACMDDPEVAAALEQLAAEGAGYDDGFVAAASRKFRIFQFYCTTIQNGRNGLRRKCKANGGRYISQHGGTQRCGPSGYYRKQWATCHL